MDPDENLAWREEAFGHSILGPWGDPFHGRHRADLALIREGIDPDVETIG
jgi:hypothetical protein